MSENGGSAAYGRQLSETNSRRQLIVDSPCGDDMPSPTLSDERDVTTPVSANHKPRCDDVSSTSSSSSSSGDRQPFEENTAL